MCSKEQGYYESVFVADPRLKLNPNDHHAQQIGVWHVIEDLQGQYYAVYINPHNGHNHDYLLNQDNCDAIVDRLLPTNWATREVVEDFVTVHQWFVKQVKSEVA
jgi:hypothetical protein